MIKPKVDQTRTKTAKKSKKKADFTLKQQRFIDCYDGNLTETAKVAGISITYASQLLKDPAIKKIIRAREKNRTTGSVANRMKRQEFWTRVFQGDEVSESTLIAEDGTKVKQITQPKMSDRLKASELLGRSEADFTDKHEHSGKIEYDHIINPMSLKALKNAVNPDSEEPKLLEIIPKKVVNS